jgi:hypothetical protein
MYILSIQKSKAIATMSLSVNLDFTKKMLVFCYRNLSAYQTLISAPPSNEAAGRSKIGCQSALSHQSNTHHTDSKQDPKTFILLHQLGYSQQNPMGWMDAHDADH